MGAQQVEPKSPPRKARLRNSWKLFVKTCFCWTTTIQRHFPQQQQDQIRRTIVTEQWTLHCWDVRPNSSCSSLWSKKMKNQIRITPVWRTYIQEIYIFKMSFLANSYVCISVFSHPYNFSSPGLLGSFLISFYILRSVLHTTSIALTKRVHVLNRKVFIVWQSFSVIVTFILNSGVILWEEMWRYSLLGRVWRLLRETLTKN